MPKTARSEREVHAKERQRQVLQLRLSGPPYASIGKQLGISDVMAIKIYKRALNAIVEPEARQERKAQTQRIYREIYLLNTQKEKLKGQEGSADAIARLSLVHFKWECWLSSLLGLDAPKQLVVEDGRMEFINGARDYGSGAGTSPA